MLSIGIRSVIRDGPDKFPYLADITSGQKDISVTEHTHRMGWRNRHAKSAAINAIVLGLSRLLKCQQYPSRAITELVDKANSKP